MKRLGKSLSVILAVLILAFSVLSVFGVSYYVGDNKNTAIKGFGDIDWGIDVSGGTSITLKAATADEADADINDAAQVIEDRAVSYGLTDYELYVNEESNTLTFVVPESVDSDYSAEELASFLTSYGELTLRPGSAYEDMVVDSSNSAAFVTPTSDTAKSVIMDGSHVTDATWFEYSEEGETYYYVNLTFDDEAAETLSALTNADTGAYYNQIISVWLDDRMLSSPTVSEPLDAGALSFSGEMYTEDKANLYSAIISTGTLPMELSVASVDTVDSTVGNNASDIIFIAGIVALIAIALVMILKYRLIGVVSVFAMLLQFGAVLAVVTGFCFGDGTFTLTIPGAAAMALSVMLSVLGCVIFGEKTKAELREGTVLGTAISTAIESGRKAIFDINFILAIIALVGMFLFGNWNLTFAIFGGASASGVYNFCFVLFFGAVFNFITGYFLPQLMIRSLQSFNAFNKPSMFGGAK